MKSRHFRRATQRPQRSRRGACFPVSLPLGWRRSPLGGVDQDVAYLDVSSQSRRSHHRRPEFWASPSPPRVGPRWERSSVSGGVMASLRPGSWGFGAAPDSLGAPLGPPSGGGAPSERLFLVLSRFHMAGSDPVVVVITQCRGMSRVWRKSCDVGLSGSLVRCVGIMPNGEPNRSRPKPRQAARRGRPPPEFVPAPRAPRPPYCGNRTIRFATGISRLRISAA